MLGSGSVKAARKNRGWTEVGYYFSAMTGMLLGLVYYGGLWYTTRYVVRVAVTGAQPVAWLKSPQLVVFLSLVIRTGLVLGGFFWTMQGQWQRMLFALAGFIIARILVKKLVLKGGEAHEYQS
jgi:F1F0 ATPase subunit 2